MNMTVGPLGTLGLPVMSAFSGEGVTGDRIDSCKGNVRDKMIS